MFGRPEGTYNTNLQRSSVWSEHEFCVPLLVCQVKEEFFIIYATFYNFSTSLAHKVIPFISRPPILY